MVDATNKDTRLTIEEAAIFAGKSESTIRKWLSPVDYLGRPKRFLESTLFGGVRYTTKDALQAFQQHGPRQVFRRQRPNTSFSASADANQDAVIRRLREHGAKV